MDNNIRELNDILKGEFMAIDIYDKYIKDCDDINIKKEFQNIQQTHKNHVRDISTRIQDIGGDPKDGTGIGGKMIEAMTNLKDVFENRQNKDIKESIYDAIKGEYMGIDLENKILNSNIDGQSKNLVNRILGDNKNIINSLEGLVN